MRRRHVFRRDAHVPGAERAGQRAGHHVQRAGVAHLLPPARGGQGIGRAAHAFRPAGQRNLGIPQHQRLICRDNRLRARSAQPVHVHRRSALGHPRLHRRDAGQIHVARLGVDDMAEDHSADLPASTPARAMAARAAWVAMSTGGMAGQGATKCANRRAGGRQDVDVGHGFTLSGRAAATAGISSRLAMTRAIVGHDATSSPTRRAL
jgi:hypothetical protein